MPMSGIDYNHIYMSIYQSVDPCHYIFCDTYCRTAEQSSLCIFRRQRIFDLFFNIFDRNETFQIKIVIYDRKFFFSGFCQDLFCLFKSHSFFCSNQPLRGHALFDLSGEIFLKFQVTVCDDTYQFFFPL